MAIEHLRPLGDNLTECLKFQGARKLFYTIFTLCLSAERVKKKAN